MNVTSTRRARRFPIQLPVKLRAVDGTQQQVQSRNVSSRGIYFELDAPLDVGSRVELLLMIPEQFTKGKPIQVRCFGKVLRVERRADKGPVGVAATIDRYLFVYDAPGQRAGRPAAF